MRRKSLHRAKPRIPPCRKFSGGNRSSKADLETRGHPEICERLAKARFDDFTPACISRCRRRRLTKCNLTVFVPDHTDRRAITGSRDRSPHGGNELDASRTAQGLGNDARLELELSFIVNFSPITSATAITATCTRRLDPICTRFFDRDDLSAQPVAPCCRDARRHAIAGHSTLDKDDATIDMSGETLTTCDIALNRHPCEHVARFRHADTLGDHPHTTRVRIVTRPIQIAPSVLPADFARLGEEVAALEAAGVDLIQWDVMDGCFVPNLTFGPDVIAAARPHTSLPFEAHLMVQNPDQMASRYVDAGCARLIVHAEACTHLHRTLENINSLGANAAVAINPATPASAIAHVLDLVDLVLVMTVNPGFGGQAYIATMEPKIAAVRAMIEASGRSEHIDLEVDGGIGPSTIAGAAAAGANLLIAGSALYRDPEGLGHAVADLRARAAAAIA